MNRSQQVDLRQNIFQDFFDIPYEDYGRSIYGADCWGLVVLVYETIGIELNQYNDSYDINNKVNVSEFINGEKEDFLKVEDEPALYDIVILNLMGYPWHCGVYLGSSKFIHIQKQIGVSIELLSNKKWNKRIDGFYRHARISIST